MTVCLLGQSLTHGNCKHRVAKFSPVAMHCRRCSSPRTTLALPWSTQMAAICQSTSTITLRTGCACLCALE